MAADKRKSLVMAQRLKELRTDKGLSHESLSKALKQKYEIDISVDSLKNYEVSKTDHVKAFKNEGMRVEYLRCLADFYGVSADYILGNINDPCRSPSAIDELGFSESVVEWFRNNLVTADNSQEYCAGMNAILESALFRSIIYRLIEYMASVKAREIFHMICRNSHGDQTIRKQTIRKIISDNVYSDAINRCLLGNDFACDIDVWELPTAAEFLQEAIVSDFSELYASRVSREFTLFLQVLEDLALKDLIDESESKKLDTYSRDIE